MPIAVFPPGLDSTLVVPVTIGAVVAAITTECLGWDFVGLVVPGYLGSVLILQPLVAIIVLAEAVATYACARFLDWGATRAGVAFPVFGRDRFFLILATSVLVRLVIEAVLLPALALRLGRAWPGLEAYQSELFGIGIVLVPLCANRLWRPGLRSGLFQLVVQVGVVRIAVQALSVTTNFSLQGFGMAYDRLALLFLSSGGVQVTLLATAALASAFNRKYGWDYHGILVPALLALVAITPIKLVTTLVETSLILVIAGAIVHVRLLRGMSFEGPRKIVLCLTVGLLLKVGLASLLAAHYPGYRPGDLFGFGYLLPSLLAERVWVKKNLPLVLIPTVQTALLGSALGAFVCFGLAKVAPAAGLDKPVPTDRYATLPQAVASLVAVLPQRVDVDLDELVRRHKQNRLTADTATGYRIFSSPGSDGMLCTRAGAKAVVLTSPSEADAGAIAAEQLGANLVIGGDPTSLAYVAKALGNPVLRPSLPASPIRPKAVPVPARTWAMSPATPATLTLPVRALAAAAHRIFHHRHDRHALAVALAPLGLLVTTSTDGRVLLDGQDWSRMVLAESPKAVVVAPHADEMHTPESAWFSAAALQADLVLPAADKTSSSLAFALAESASLPLLSVRGTALPNAEALIVGQPEPERPARIPWLAPLDSALEGRMRVVRDPSLANAALRAFTPGSGQSVPVALLWLSPQGRRILGAANADALATPEAARLARERRVSTEAGDLADWLLVSKGRPEPAALTAAERLARTQDVAMLASRYGQARVTLLRDEARGITAVALLEGPKRALVIPGDGRRDEVAIRDRAMLDRALLQGARILSVEGQR